MALQVDNYLWLLAFIPMFIVLFLFWRNNTLLTGGRKWALLLIRTIVFACVITALAGLQTMWPVNHLSTVFVVDRSHSMLEHEQSTLEDIQDAAKQKGLEDQLGIISTGAQAAIELPLTDQFNSSQFQTEVNRSYTDLGAGLQLAGSLFSTNDRGRIVLLTDGNENIGDSTEQASFLNKQGYTVDVLPLSPTHKEDVAIDSFDVPDMIYLGEQANLSLTLDSTIDTTSQIRIQQNGRVILDQTITINEGTNRFSFPHLVTDDGLHTFKAEIVADDDQVVENNQLSAFAETKGIPRVLVVEGQAGVAANLEHALQSSAVEINTISPEILPTELTGYLSYDSIIFSNVPAHVLSGEQMEVIETAVKDFGIGFVMTGGDESFGVGGYFKTPIEELMPVYMDIKGKQELPSLGLMIVLDKSGSMQGNKIALAREAAARSIELLRKKDTMGVIAFDSTPWQVVETAPIEDKQEVIEQVRSITASGGTDIFTPTQQAYEQLTELDLQRKHIILLTDGQSQATLNYQQMIEAGKENGITLSTVAIGMGADGPLLEEMAEIGDGRFYQVQNNSSIPTILSRETALVTRTYIEDDPFYPKVIRGSDWSTYMDDGVPQMNAYIATTPKDRSQNVLISERDDPVLSHWQYGLGKTVAWTSDLTGEWSGDWPSFNNWSPLWNDIVTSTFPQFETKAYQVNQTIEGNQVTLQVSSADNTFSKLNTSLVSDTGTEMEFALQPTAPGEYQGVFTAEEPGVYFLQITEQQSGQPTSAFRTGIVIPYSQEYTFTPTNDVLIEQIAEAGGGKVLENLDHAFSTEDIPPRYERQELFYLLLVIALLLFIIDVAIRRFRINFAFLSKLSINRKDKQTESKQALESREAQIGRLKRASTKKDTGKQIAPSANKQVQHKQKERLNNQTKAQSNSLTDSTKRNNNSRQEKMQRLLDAKNKKR